MFQKKIGIDLGTTTVLVYVPKRGIIINEPSVVAVSTVDRKVLAVGKEAKDMLGRTPDTIVARRPLKDGVIADYRTTEAMLRYFINKATGGVRFIRPEVMVAVPGGITSTERRAVIDATLAAVMDFFLSDPTRARLCVREALERPDELRVLVREHLGPYLGLIADYIRWGQRDGTAHPDVNPEAWLIHVLHMTVTMVAFAPVTEALAGDPPEECLARQKTELVRLARAALLNPT